MDETRPRGFLTEADRKFLREGPEGYSRQARYQRERDIRERFVNAVLDFSVLLEHREAVDIGRAIREDKPDPNLRRGFTDLIAYLYGIMTGFQPPFTTIVEAGIAKGGREWEERAITADLEIKTHIVPNFEELKDRIERGALDELSDAERRWIVEIAEESGLLSAETLEEAFRETPFGRYAEEVNEEG